MDSDTYGQRNLRLKFYMDITEFDRLCHFLSRESTLLQYAFPWYDFSQPGDLEELGTEEEALKMFEEEIGPLLKNLNNKTSEENSRFRRVKS